MYAEFFVLNVIILIVIVLSNVVLIIPMLSVVILNVIMLSVGAPHKVIVCCSN